MHEARAARARGGHRRWFAVLPTAIAAAAIAAGALLVDRPPASMASPTLGPPFRHTLRIETAGTIVVAFRDNYPLRLWPDGRLLVGDEYLFDVATGASERLAVARGPVAGPSVFPISDGRVVLIDDRNPDGSIVDGPHQVAILDPGTGAVTQVGRLQPYASQQAVLVLRDGRIVVSGGIRMKTTEPEEALASAYVFDVRTGATTQLQSMRQPRFTHTMLELLDGRVLVVGGEVPEAGEDAAPSTTVEVYDLGAGTSTSAGERTAAPGWDPSLRMAQLAGGRVVISGPFVTLEPCGPLPPPPGALIGDRSSVHAVSRTQSYVFDPATGNLVDGLLVPPPTFNLIPLGGDRVLLSNVHRAFDSCAFDAKPVRYPWLGIADFRSAALFDSPNPLTGEGTLDVRPDTVYASGVLLPDGRVALIEAYQDPGSCARCAPGEWPDTRRIDVLTIGP